MISIILQVVWGVAVLLGMINAVSASYLFYRRKVTRAREQTTELINSKKVDDRIEEVVKLIGGIGIMKALISSYSEVKGELVSAFRLDQREDITEREYIQKLQSNPLIKPIGNELERIYKTYERLRFGYHVISTEEVKLFLSDLREVYKNLNRIESMKRA